MSSIVRRRADVELKEGFSYRRCTQMDADSFRVFRVFRGYIPTVLIPAQRERWQRRFFAEGEGPEIFE